ncbi:MULTISPECIES: class I SAM-dependent methyltransferase [unclassified Streptomyces]|uniref:class I SAM-dependent methyltransferase n=1 Tax=unclassified Streptomyces TaxID=2593676 RepID=UPI002442C71F|nr:class I SAM-dependent methyltransferase [Streptomyces sp. DH41]MDG9728377.1 class I SAM-dependent methyltransferase [Streptomyces sp. DH41]
MIDSDVLGFYNLGLEQTRLQDPRRSVEFWRTRDVLARHLPPPPATVLDVGGGPGAYALALADDGYDVTLVDPVPLHISQATQASRAHERALRRALCGDAREVPVDEQHDAVLLLGPLYHLITADDRARAWSEARRCVRPGGVIVAAAASRYYACWESLASDKMPLPGVAQALEMQLRTGEYRNPSGEERLWTTAYFHAPDELAAEARSAGLLVRSLVAVEGPAKLLGDLGERMADPERRQHVLDTQRRIEEEHSVLGLSQHMLAIAERPADR